MGSVHAQAAGLLDAVTARLADPPQRRYVADGQPAHDCSQLTVYIAGIHRGTTLRERPTVACAPTTVTAVVERVWCVPTATDTSKAPRMTTLADSGQAVTDGAQELWDAVTASVAALDCNAAVVEARSVAPSGGVVAWQITTQWTV